MLAKKVHVVLKLQTFAAACSIFNYTNISEVAVSVLENCRQNSYIKDKSTISHNEIF